MENRRAVCVLDAFRPYLRILQTYNAENFCKKPASPKIGHVKQALFVSLAMVAATLVAFLSIWHLAESIRGLDEFATSLAVVLTLIQLIITCVIFMHKSQQISGTIADVQRIVNERKLIYHPWI